jgi:hypothetical protein
MVQDKFGPAQVEAKEIKSWKRTSINLQQTCFQMKTNEKLNA